MRYAVLAAMLLACSKDPDCEEIQKDINEAAAKRGVDPKQACTSTNPDVRRDFDPACTELRKCKEDE